MQWTKDVRDKEKYNLTDVMPSKLLWKNFKGASEGDKGSFVLEFDNGDLAEELSSRDINVKVDFADYAEKRSYPESTKAMLKGMSFDDKIAWFNKEGVEFVYTVTVNVGYKSKMYKPSICLHKNGTNNWLTQDSIGILDEAYLAEIPRITIRRTYWNYLGGEGYNLYLIGFTALEDSSMDFGYYG